jgi:hypothetical protein
MHITKARGCVGWTLRCLGDEGCPNPFPFPGDSTTPKSRFSGEKRPELSSGCLSTIWKRTAGLKESLVPEAARNLATCGALSTGAHLEPRGSEPWTKLPPPTARSMGAKIRRSPRDQPSTEPPSGVESGALAKSPATGGVGAGVASSPKTSPAISPSRASPAGAVSSSNPSGTSTSMPTSR